jgi:RNA polymerase primary sigma factor
MNQIFADQILKEEKYNPLSKKEIDKLFEKGNFEEIKNRHLRLVMKLAWKYKSPNLVEDLISEGMFGLERALEKYDPSNKAKFSTYASWWIRQKMTIYMNNTVKNSHLSMDKKISSESDNEFSNFIEDDEKYIPNNQTFEEDKIHIQNLILNLKEKDQKILKMYFGLDDGMKKSYEDVAKVMKMTRQAIRASVLRSLEKLKKEIK